MPVQNHQKKEINYFHWEPHPRDTRSSWDLMKELQHISQNHLMFSFELKCKPLLNEIPSGPPPRETNVVWEPLLGSISIIFPEFSETNIWPLDGLTAIPRSTPRPEAMRRKKVPPVSSSSTFPLKSQIWNESWKIENLQRAAQDYSQPSRSLW